MREILRSEELPAQWQKYPLKTQQEMFAGRKSVADAAFSNWADQAESWLRVEFNGKGLDFHTAWDSSTKTITLRVFRYPPADNLQAFRDDAQLIFQVTEPAESFITPTTLTKIILIAG